MIVTTSSYYFFTECVKSDCAPLDTWECTVLVCLIGTYWTPWPLGTPIKKISQSLLPHYSVGWKKRIFCTEEEVIKKIFCFGNIFNRLARKEIWPKSNLKVGFVILKAVWTERDWHKINSEQAQLRLCKLGPATVLIFYKSLAPTPIYHVLIVGPRIF